MTGTYESIVNWSDGSEDELVRELLDDDSPFFVLPNTVESIPDLGLSPKPVTNQIMIFSGPTIDDIESALSTTHRNLDINEQHTSPRPTISMMEKRLSKMENKYTLKIKSCGNSMADDGYKWRKYGQKSIKNSPNPRSYYRCTNPRCSAKKQVEKSTEDPDTLIVTYEGLHLHFAYSHFLLTRPSDYSNDLHPTKRPKILTTPEQAQAHPSPQVDPTTIVPQQDPCGEVASPIGTPQGLLEDVVPLVIRNPLNNHAFPNELCMSPYPSSPPSSSSSCVSWSPNSTSFDVGVFSSIW
ncbi:probable WRKY transcription factor 49 [Magnolia sinica]|uniref:probable WRKY transcription factor 49 n=1 Tax=Magnolia sinica TaxID=86752 RepID=UPI00265B2A90|nr:probable WRKY transcription factor 49 [Magnolia sinica]